jgi:antitoxin VapB
MPLSIKDPDADRLARALAQRTGETLTEAVINALRERLERELRKEQTIDGLVEDVMEIGRHCASLPVRAALLTTDQTILGKVALHSQLRCITSRLVGESTQAVEGHHVRENPKTDGIDRACCYASRVERWCCSADDSCTRGRLSYRAKFSRAVGEPLVLSHGFGETAQVLVHTRNGSVGAARDCASNIRSSEPIAHNPHSIG